MAIRYSNESFIDLEIHIFPREASPVTGESAGYSVRLRLGGEMEFAPGHLTVDALSWVSSGDPVADGRRLFDMLFADPQLRGAWAEARRRAAQRRIRLWIDKDVPELHALPWELLQDKGVPLSAYADTPFSRYLPNDTPWGGPVQERPIRILAVISNPDDLETKYGLAQLDVDQERELLETPLGGFEGHIQLDFMEPPVTLERLADYLRQGYHVLHYVGHGSLGRRRQQQAALYMQDGEGNTQIILDEEFIGMLSRQRARPRLVFLTACQTATCSTADALLGLGPRLVRAGVPAVVAIKDSVTIRTARSLSQVFYRQLAEHGVVDLAMNEARCTLLAAGRPDVAMPVLFMRLKEGQIFADEDKSVGDAWALVQAKAQESEETQDALAELARRFQGVSTRVHKLDKFMMTYNHLRELRTAFALCTGVVERAGRDPDQSTLIYHITSTWGHVRRERLGRLQVFVGRQSDLDTTTWFPQLMEKAAGIDSSLAQLALKPLVESIKTFEQLLAEAEFHLQQQVDQAIADLVILSDQTLDRLDVK